MMVTFCGHSSIPYSEEIRKKLRRVIEGLVSEGADEFLLGGYGAFDEMAAYAVKGLKTRFPNIRSVLVIPYIDRGYDTELYDCSVFPPLENVPKRFAILRRNIWMADQADILVSYVKYDWGGAVKMLEYAMKRKKRIINLAAE